IIQKSDFKNISTKSNVVDGFFEEYYETCEKVDKRGNVIKWIDSHPIIDSKMNLDPDYDAYLFCYQQLQSGNAAIIVIDISKQGIQEFLDEVDLGEGSILGFVTMNGHELLSYKGEFEDDGKTVFSGRDYYKTVLNSEAQDGILEVEYNGDDCVLFYSKCEDSGNVITAMIPVSLITLEAASIWWLTIILVIIAMVVVLVIAFVISSNIQKNVNSVSKGLGAVAEGNLTVKVRVDGHDEFVDLADATTNMISNTKNLVAKVDTAAEGVADSAKSVQGASKTLGNCSDDIMRAMGEMSDGMERQKKYADECVNATDRLSNEITNVSTQLGNIKGIVDETNRLISESVKLLQSLGDKARETTKATDSVKSSVSALLDETGKINSFVNVIKNISSQTHLLSLNASIEAARAGEAGRGFSVVAEEIRTLATESSRSAGEIKKLVDGINAQTDSSVGSVDMAQNIADEEFVLVNSSIELFDQMKASMESLTEELTNIGRAASAADQRRVEAVSAVDDISEIINESTANADTVIVALDRLKKNVDHLDDTAAKLGENMDELKNEVRVFRI
ncbi:MAG: methyl-accepting chemotaxis protein, partial [Lachnospiraceae bacterium]|nr:methyl-accepting chemotaxis protein [Lachnospiraceae bacterium]